MNTKVHFTEEEIAICADKINIGQYNSLPESLRQHLAECDECADEVLMVADIAFDFKMIETKSKKHTLPRWIYIASISSAAAILLFGIFKMIEPNNNDTRNNLASSIHDSLENKKINSEENTAIIDTVSLKINAESINKNKQQLASLAPNEKLEKLYNNFEGSYRSNDIEIVTKGILTYPNVDSLKWMNKLKAKLILEIFDNKENTISKISLNASSEKIPTLPTGLYYWKLINEDYELLYVGKIISK